jgi:uncharacterized protein with NRDE domain
MCLVALTIGQSERFPFVLVSNRDEFFARASRPLAWWLPSGGLTQVLSGIDTTGGGTWLGLNAVGRLALVTNVREPGQHINAAPSRGELVVQCLAGPGADLQALASAPRNGFNLLSIDLARAHHQRQREPIGHWVSNRPVVQGRPLATGVFGLSNAALDTPWPKVQTLKQRLSQAASLLSDREQLTNELFDALQDPKPAPDALLPQTGISTERERQLSSAFIHIAGATNTGTGTGAGGAYGTRCSTVVVVEHVEGRRTVHVVERTHGSTWHENRVQTQRFELPFEA